MYACNLIVYDDVVRNCVCIKKQYGGRGGGWHGFQDSLAFLYLQSFELVVILKTNMHTSSAQDMYTVHVSASHIQPFIFKIVQTNPV